MMRVQVRVFFELREIIGKPEVEIELEDGATVKEAIEQLIETHGSKLSQALLNPSTGEMKAQYSVLINGKETRTDGVREALADGDTVSILKLLFGG